ncbi:MAG: metalloregulator ArsR/SmtB family transcription factor [Sedimenticola sp.]
MTPEMLFKALSDPTRLRCLFLLSEHDELCVCELTHAMGLPQPKISHHLGSLRKTEIVSDRKEGLWIYYKINPDLPEWATQVIQAAVAGTKRCEPFTSDAITLAEMPDRPGGACCA